MKLGSQLCTLHTLIPCPYRAPLLVRISVHLVYTSRPHCNHVFPVSVFAVHAALLLQGCACSHSVFFRACRQALRSLQLVVGSCFCWQVHRVANCVECCVLVAAIATCWGGSHRCWQVLCFAPCVGSGVWWQPVVTMTRVCVTGIGFQTLHLASCRYIPCNFCIIIPARSLPWTWACHAGVSLCSGDCDFYPASQVTAIYISHL